MGENLPIASRIFSVLIIGAVAISAILALVYSAPVSADRQAERMEYTIKKAAVQCYALEGAYPDDLHYLERYGVLFDNEHFYYRYEFNGISNYMPDIFVVPR
jgi:hypothetical protein